MYYGWKRGCVVCDREFTVQRRDTLYCSKACKQKAWRMRGGSGSKGVTDSGSAAPVAFRMERRK
jgi:hypothetical protein